MRRATRKISQQSRSLPTELLCTIPGTIKHMGCIVFEYTREENGHC